MVHYLRVGLCHFTHIGGCSGYVFDCVQDKIVKNLRNAEKCFNCSKLILPRLSKTRFGGIIIKTRHLP